MQPTSPVGYIALAVAGKSKIWSKLDPDVDKVLSLTLEVTLYLSFSNSIISLFFNKPKPQIPFQLWRSQTQLLLENKKEMINQDCDWGARLETSL